MTDRKGMTLTGLILSLAGIALFLSFVVPMAIARYELKLTERADLELARLQLAVTSYWRHHNNKYPPDLKTLLSAEPRVISSLLNDPFDAEGKTYGYSADSKTGYFVLWSRGPRGDTIEPQVANGRVVYQGSGIVVSNFPIERGP